MNDLSLSSSFVFAKSGIARRLSPCYCFPPSWDVQKFLDPCFRLTRSPTPHPSQQPILPSALSCFHVLLLLFMHFLFPSPWSGDKTGEGG